MQPLYMDIIAMALCVILLLLIRLMAECRSPGNNNCLAFCRSGIFLILVPDLKHFPLAVKNTFLTYDCHKYLANSPLILSICLRSAHSSWSAPWGQIKKLTASGDAHNQNGKRSSTNREQLATFFTGHCKLQFEQSSAQLSSVTFCIFIAQFAKRHNNNNYILQ